MREPPIAPLDACSVRALPSMGGVRAGSERQRARRRLRIGSVRVHGSAPQRLMRRAREMTTRLLARDIVDKCNDVSDYLATLQRCETGLSRRAHAVSSPIAARSAVAFMMISTLRATAS